MLLPPNWCFPPNARKLYRTFTGWLISSDFGDNGKQAVWALRVRDTRLAPDAKPVRIPAAFRPTAGSLSISERKAATTKSTSARSIWSRRRGWQGAESTWPGCAVERAGRELFFSEDRLMVVPVRIAGGRPSPLFELRADGYRVSADGKRIVATVHLTDPKTAAPRWCSTGRGFGEVVIWSFFASKGDSFCPRVTRGQTTQNDRLSYGLEDVAAQVLVLYDVGELGADVVGIYFYRFFLQVRAFEGDLFEQLLHDGVQPARADVFGAFVDRAANLATSSRASSVKISLMPSVSSSAEYCLASAFFGSFRMRMKSSTVRDFSSTRIGKRPCSSGIMSLGLET